MKTIKERLFGDPNKQSEKAAKVIFQVEEYKGKLWLTFNGSLVCPMEMFKTETIEALTEIRKLYVERNTTDE